jgi:hypothetical protein
MLGKRRYDTRGSFKSPAANTLFAELIRKPDIADLVAAFGRVPKDMVMSLGVNTEMRQGLSSRLIRGFRVPGEVIREERSWKVVMKGTIPVVRGDRWTLLNLSNFPMLRRIDLTGVIVSDLGLWRDKILPVVFGRRHHLGSIVLRTQSVAKPWAQAFVNTLDFNALPNLTDLTWYGPSGSPIPKGLDTRPLLDQVCSALVYCDITVYPITLFARNMAQKSREGLSEMPVEFQ